MINYRLFIGTKDKDMRVYCYDNKMYESAINYHLEQCGIDGATIYNATGIWKGTRENSFIIEILDTENNLQKNIYDFIKNINKAFNQNCILLETQNIQAEFIEQIEQ